MAEDQQTLRWRVDLWTGRRMGRYSTSKDIRNSPAKKRIVVLENTHTSKTDSVIIEKGQCIYTETIVLLYRKDSVVIQKG